MIELYEFQKEAADQIVERFQRHYDDPPMKGTQKTGRVVPFFQALSSITASGKTVILADAVSSMSALLPVAPVVIWLSKGKVVVRQSYANLDEAGKYHHLLAPAKVSTLAEYDATEVADAETPLVYFATVGTFNQRDREQGDRAIYRSDIDNAESSTWDALKQRTMSDGVRRPLLVMYDEGHNLSDQQTELLLELEPDAIVAASATMRLPQALAREVRYLQDVGWEENELVTQVDAKAVADTGLVKSTVSLAGYEAPMEETVSCLLKDMTDAEKDAAAHEVGLPKAIYVCKTNIVEGDSLQRDDPKRPFNQRQAPPILIWRHLTEHGEVPPEDIAVYCSLKFDKDHPPPDGFRLFGGGDNDYEDFTSGDFRHVIFNLGLQEGWDDPLAYFAYIDKSMESNVQVEQVIGRLLRQPGQQHYPAARLNTAHFYVRVDRRNVFNDLLDDVSSKLESEAPAIKLVKTPPGKPKPEPVEPKEQRTVFETAYSTDDAVQPIGELLESMTDYRNDDGTNTQSAGGRANIQRLVGDDSSGEFQWEEFEHTNMVSARWLFNRAVSRRFKGALGLSPTDSAKFDAMVGFGSPAHKQIARVAADIVDAYIDNVFLKQKRLDPYEVSSALVRKDELVRFENALHEGYSDMNALEVAFAKALDETGLPWCRNLSRSGYGIPLISIGRTSTFYPDFLVWKDDDVFAVDTTGGHLLGEKTGRKLLAIGPPKNGAGQLVVRFVSEGRWNDDLEQQDTSGYTVWGQKQDRSLRATAVDSVADTVDRALKKPS